MKRGHGACNVYRHSVPVSALDFALCGRTRCRGNANLWAFPHLAPALQAMLNPSWRLRPTADSCLLHPFLTGERMSVSSGLNAAPPGQEQL